MKRMLFVMNPYAGVRRAARYLTDILSVFNRAGYEVVIHMTSSVGDAREVVRTRAAGMDLVVCCGGDGTLNETVTGMMQAELNIPIGYIPAGSTNDFAASLKLSTVTVQAARDIVEGQPVPYDVGKFADRYFTYVACFGAFTKSSYSTPQSVKNALGHMAYVLESIQEISQIRDVHVRMEIDGETVEDDFLFGAISNSTSVGGILSLSPDQVDMGDGLFEILLIRAPRSFAELTQCIQALQNGRYNDCNMITFCSARSVKVYADKQMAWTLDGEKFDGAEEIAVENLHRAIQLVHRV